MECGGKRQRDAALASAAGGFAKEKAPSPRGSAGAVQTCRAARCEAILSHSNFELPASDFAHIDAAVSGLRRAGTQHRFPPALLTRAWLRAWQGNLTGPESAQEDLDEAWDIAERGLMRLFMADIHLTRCRLFGNPKAEARNPKNPWESPAADLAAAEKIIRHETTFTRPEGTVITARYARRDEELADAKQALGFE
ncbi:MAG: hypothetical protein H7A46_16225 [Verrucomicrobiales bacterium]|nr:hypothetical protein [Verrucomicrobiales bacterium]